MLDESKTAEQLLLLKHKIKYQQHKMAVQDSYTIVKDNRIFRESSCQKHTTGKEVRQKKQTKNIDKKKQ